MFNTSLKIAALASIALLSVASPAITYIDRSHTDIGIGFDTGTQEWELHIHDEDTDTEFEPDEAILVANEQSLTARPGGSQWDFLGNAAGDDTWILPAVQNPDLLFLGVGSEELPGDYFDRYDASAESGGRVSGNGRWLRLTLKDVSGPGDFSAWINSVSGPRVFLASSDGITTDDSIWVLEGGHTDFNWGFSTFGRYEVTFAASAFKDGQLLQSEDVTYTFDAVPEPASMLALAAGAIALLRRRKK
jgi:surface-anchored protein